MKIDAKIYGSHNPYGEYHWVSRLRENFTSGSEGEGLETGNLAPRQSFTRQLFFKWIKQHLRIKKFFGISETAVKTQIWIAISVYVLVAIMKKNLSLDYSLYTILQVLSISLFEKTHISRLFTESDYNNKFTTGHIQLNLFGS